MVRSLAIFIFGLVAFASAHDSPIHKESENKVCTTFSEFALVLDESPSIKDDDWKDVINFAQKIVTKLGISADGNRAGIASFTDTARFRITCDQHKKTEDFVKAISGLTQGKGKYTNMEDGLIKGQRLLSESGCGTREFPKVLVILSDGIPNKRPPPLPHTPKEDSLLVSLFNRARSIRTEHTKIIAIGVGEQFDRKKEDGHDSVDTSLSILRGITGNPKLVFTSETFDQLTDNDFIKKIVDPICTDPLKISVKPVPRTKPPKPTQPIGGSKTDSPTKATPKKQDTTKAPQPTTARPAPPGPTEDPDTGICRCQGVTETDFPALGLSVFDIEHYPGEARKDKVKAAIADLLNQRRQIKALRLKYNGCKKALRNTLLKTVHKYKEGTELFFNIDECTANAECKLPTWIMRIEEKKCKLEDELRWYQGTFGRIYDYGENAYNQLSGVWK